MKNTSKFYTLFKVSIFGIALVVLINIAYLLFSETVAAKEQNPIFLPKMGIHYKKITHSKEVDELLKKLNIANGETFEIMSYNCPACYRMEKFLNFLKNKKNISVRRLQLGSNVIPMAQAEYYVKTFAPSQISDFREKMFKEMLSGKTLKDKVDFAKFIPIRYGVNTDQLSKMEFNAEEYGHLTEELADELAVDHTPTIFINGQYELIQKNHDSYHQFNITIEHIFNLDKTSNKNIDSQSQ